jgi:hypothetical protein
MLSTLSMPLSRSPASVLLEEGVDGGEEVSRKDYDLSPSW